MKRVYVCSPLGDPSPRVVQENIDRARRLCLLAMADGEAAAWAPHGFYPTFLDDHDPEERELGIQAGSVWLSAADEVWVWSLKGITGGMRSEIELADELNIPVVMDPGCWDGVDA